MKLFDKLERLEQGIGRTVGFSKGFGTFAKADVANRIRTSMDDASYVDQGGHTMAPNIFNVRFSSADFSRVREWGNPFAVELCNLAISHARAQGYSLIGAVRITFSPIADLEADEFEVVPSFEAFQAPPSGATNYVPPAGAAHGASDYAPVAPARDTGLPTRITKPRATPPRRTEQPQQQQQQASAASAPKPRSPQNPPQQERAAAHHAFVDINGQRYELSGAPLVIGRGSDASVRLADKGISRRHLQISRQGGNYVATDLGSTNGTRLNGFPLKTPTVLQDGAVLQLGGARVLFRSIASGGIR